jgi:hypothetical protein
MNKNKQFPPSFINEPSRAREPCVPGTEATSSFITHLNVVFLCTGTSEGLETGPPLTIMEESHQREHMFSPRIPPHVLTSKGLGTLSTRCEAWPLKSLDARSKGEQ